MLFLNRMLLLLLIWRIEGEEETCELDGESRLRVISPRSHSLIEAIDGTVEIYFELNDFQIPIDGKLQLTAPDFEFTLTTASNVITMRNIAPGSYFITLELQNHRGDPIEPRISLHFEIIRNVFDLKSNRYVPPTRETVAKDISNTSSREKPTICFVSSLRFDGQKRIWLQQMQSLQFPFCFITFGPIDNGPMRSVLEEENIPIYTMELVITNEEAMEFQIDASNYLPILFLHEPKVDTTASGDVQFEWKDDRVPQWCRRIWMNTVTTLKDTRADVVVFGNSVSDTDVLLTKALKLAGIRTTIFELTNLHPVQLTVSHLVLPSHFALHSVLKDATVSYDQHHVIYPGVDTEIFLPNPKRRAPGGRVGYVGRLSCEKSLGLLIQSAVYLKQIRPQARMIIVGDGPQRQALEQYSRELQLDDFIQFTGGIYDDHVLAQIYQSIDVFALPTLRTETFGLSNIEAMASGAPVVSFGVGGIGQYLDHALNGFVVDTADPKQFAQVILSILADRQLGQRLSEQAVKTIHDHFTIQHSMDKYHALYSSI